MLIFKGFIIGIGKIIPGVSGSILAISLGLYEKLINSINNFFKDIVGNSKFLIKILIGVLIAIILFSKVVVFLLNKYYVVTIFTFIGLIVGSLQDIKKETKIKKHYLLFFIVLLLLILINYLSFKKELNIDNGIINFIYWIFAGFVEAFSTVVPGISGTSMLMMIGAYDKLMVSLSNVLNVDIIVYNLSILLPFLIGMIGGIFAVSKLIYICFKKQKEKTYCVILAFSYSAIIIMLVNCINKLVNFYDILIGLVLFSLSYFISKKVNHLSSD